MEKGDVFERFSFLEEKGHIISFVGAGGKTTWMYRMAEYYSARGYRVLVTTTTHIWIPEGNGWVKSLEEAENKWNKGEYVVVGEEAKWEIIIDGKEKTSKLYEKGRGGAGGS